MRKKLLSTLAAVSMLANVVTPVMAAKPSHEGTGHYAYSTGSEGQVTDAAFLKESYTIENGEDENMIDYLMAWVNDDTLAHELRYVEWYIENHDSNYPFSLESSTNNDGKVYCGFDSGSATITAIITRDDGTLVKASTKLIAEARTIQYATGFYFDEGTSKTLYTGAASISGGNKDNSTGGYDSYQSGEYNRLTIKPTPSNAVFSKTQYDEIAAAIAEGTNVDGSNMLNVNLTTANDEDYWIEPIVQSWSDITTVEWNGYTGVEEIQVYYPIGHAATGDTNVDQTNGKVVFEINDPHSLMGYGGGYIGDAEIFERDGEGFHGSNFVEDLVDSLTLSDDYDARIVDRTENTTSYYRAMGEDSVFVEITMKTNDALDREDLMEEIAELMGVHVTGLTEETWEGEPIRDWGSNSSSTGDGRNNGTDYYGAGNNNGAGIGYPVNFHDYGFVWNASAKSAFGEFLTDTGVSNDLVLLDTESRLQVLDFTADSATWTELNLGYSDGYKVTAESYDRSELFAKFIDANAYNGDKVEYVLWDTSTNTEATDDADVDDLVLRAYDNDATVTTSSNLDGLTGRKVFMGDFNGGSSGYTMAVGTKKTESDVNDFPEFSSKNSDYFTFSNAGTSKKWDAPQPYIAPTVEAGTASEAGTLRGYDNNWGTPASDYTLSVDNFTRYQGTYPAENKDNQSRSIRINSVVAVQPSSFHQTSSITVAVGDVMDLPTHFKPTSTTNVNWNPTYDERYLNNDSSYAYNDYGVILEENKEVLGVRTGKNTIEGSVYNSATGVTHTGEVVVTVVPRTGISSTVTPTSQPLTVTPGTHTTTLGGAGIQLTAKYFGEDEFDVNDNVLPTTQSSSNGKIQDEVVFISNDPTVLSVNDDGFVTPVGVGTGTVTVKVPNSDYEATFTMTVIAPVIPQEDTTEGPTSVPSTGVNVLGQLF